MTLNEKLNSLTRLIGVSCLALWATNDDGNINALVLGTLLLFVIWTIWKFKGVDKKEKFELPKIASKKEDPFSKERCKYPSPNNPFMNISPYDFGSNSDFLPACRGSEIAKSSEEMFLKGTYDDGQDLFGRKSNSSRQWVVAPNQIDPDSYDFYVNWRMKGNPTCKENSLYCRPKMHSGQSWLDAN